MNNPISICQVKNIYEQLINSKFSYNYIVVFFFVKHYININTFNFAKKKQIKPIENDLYDELFIRFGSKCIVTGSNIFEHTNILAKTNLNDVNNWILLNKQHAEYFKKYYWSINPDTFEIEINYDLISKNDVFVKLLENKTLSDLSKYPGMMKYIIKHYENFIYNETN